MMVWRDVRSDGGVGDVRNGGGVERCEKGWRDVRNGGGVERCEKWWWCGEM